MSSNSYHTPVLLAQCVQYLNLQKGGVYVDCTLGGGNHSLALLQACPDIQLYGFDQDAEAIRESEQKLQPYADRVNLIRANFSMLRTELALRRVKQVDGVLYDLGVSSRQLDNGERGFSIDKNAPLDMRMDQSQELDAAYVVNNLSEPELKKIFKEYGEELHAGRIAKAILRSRATGTIATTGDLVRIIESVAGKGTKESLKTKIRVFQGLRIYVNGELDVLSPSLQDAIDLLSIGGRIVVLSYHSLEDRIVKNLFRTAATGCDCSPQAVVCSCSKKSQLKLLTKRPLQSDASEVEENSRSRSVRLRAAEKCREEK